MPDTAPNGDQDRVTDSAARWSLVGKTITVYGYQRGRDDEATCDFGAKHKRYWYKRLSLTVTESWQEDGGYNQIGPSYRAVGEDGKTYVKHYHYDNGSGWVEEEPRPENPQAYFDRPFMHPAFDVETGGRFDG